ncbi:hypothetical protein SARC_17137, partial [Sphaeroforma arctica JP610]
VRNRKREALKNSRSGVSKQRMRLMVEQFGDGDDQTKSMSYTSVYELVFIAR